MENKLNEMEEKVLFACSKPNTEFDGESFQAEDVRVEGLAKNQIKGYLSQLVQKGFIIVWGQGSYYSAKMTEKGLAFLGLPY